ncbi:hypothetical protein B0I00_1206 [Novosphingobium kunmingense]|uniref:Argininosuccinate lyase n=1 Tax=Novosphingobium kunmingense TaxID=1211806 RepID=A0A2N0I488_9SPHN|nr:hypothetical protein [Novosphingobium kunmingense]PKB25998.1 hypothetical protein B0I00_1206 [Novosphingobium kunmingense]
MRRLAVLALVLALAACGQRAKLSPPPGKALPVAAYGADAQADADTLLTPPPQAAPERSVELRKRSEDRTEDPFDLPPPE